MQKRKSLGRKAQKVGSMKILVLHGWTYSIQKMEPLAKWNPFLDQIKSKDYKPILLKIPGLTKNIHEVWNLEKYVEWLKKEVKREKVILIGHSNGGRISLAFAQKYPQKVTHLILIDSAGVYHNELPLRLKRFVFKNLAKLGRKITSSEKLRVFLYKLTREGDYKNATLQQRQTMVNLINTDLTPILSDIKIPTLIIWGKDDTVTPLTDGIVMNKLIENSKLFVIEDAKHSPMFTSPKRVAEIISGEIGK